MKQYTLVQLFEICQARWRSAEVGRPLFFARTDQTKPLPEPTWPTRHLPTGRPILNQDLWKTISNRFDMISPVFMEIFYCKIPHFDREAISREFCWTFQRPKMRKKASQSSWEIKKKKIPPKSSNALACPRIQAAARIQISYFNEPHSRKSANYF